MAASSATSRRPFATAAAALVLAVCCLQAAAAAAEGARYSVGGPDGWRVPPPEDREKYYANWASGITFYVGDSIEFVYKNDTVIKVGKAGYYHCNETVPGAAPRDGTTLFVLDAAGPAYFASADLARCAMGERLMLDVLLLPAEAPGPWSSWAPSPSPSAHHSGAAVAATHAVVVAVLVPVALALAAGFLLRL